MLLRQNVHSKIFNNVEQALLIVERVNIKTKIFNQSIKIQFPKFNASKKRFAKQVNEKKAITKPV